VFDNVRKKIGSLGRKRCQNTPTECLEKYSHVAKSYLTSFEFISAPNTFEGTVAAVYFVIELPDAWGPLLPDFRFSKRFSI
jgi:hypothetical protein